MTYGVPYSFVPGTKAKADEVNANFVDILDKIQATNTRIDTTNNTSQHNLTQVQAALGSKAKADFSNITPLAQAKFDAKADKTELDGAWTAKHAILVALGKTTSAGTTHTYSLASYLPNDSAKYEILLGITAQTSGSSNDYVYLLIKTDYITSAIPCVRAITRHSNTSHAACQVSTIVSKNRNVSVVADTACVGTPTYGLYIFAYRKVR